MEWSEKHDILLCREVLVLQPFEHPYRSKERGEVWPKIAINLNGLKQPTFKVSKRSVRDRLTLLQSRFKEKIRRGEGAPGIDCEESELDQALEEILTKRKLLRLAGKITVELSKKMKSLLQRNRGQRPWNDWERHRKGKVVWMKKLKRVEKVDLRLCSTYERKWKTKKNLGNRRLSKKPKIMR